MTHYTTMSTRSWSAKAVVLSLSSFGEGHREAQLLVEDSGLIRAAVFGGAKSKLRALVSPWQTGTAWIYSDPVKKTNKITDFDVTSYRQGIREDLVRAWCASCCTEIVTRSHGIADWRLVNAFLDGISVSPEDECRLALLRFLWRVIIAAGLNPDIGACARCGQSDENEVLYYLPHEDLVACANCLGKDPQWAQDRAARKFPLSREAIVYLLTVERLSPAEARRLRPNEAAFAELRQFLFFLASRMMDGNLKTLESGEGIL